MKTVLITGVGKGIGKALAKRFLAEKYFVVGTYLSHKPDISSNRFVGYPLNLASEKSIGSCVRSISKAKYRFDICINNAGVLLDEDETKVVVSKLRKTLEVNLIGTIAFTEHLLPHLKRGGQVINISSTAGSLELVDKDASHHPNHYPSYKISKAALNMYTRTLAQRLRGRKIGVSSVHPGWVKTDMGGDEAEISPEKAAKQIFDFAITRHTSGRFWYASKPLPW